MIEKLQNVKETEIVLSMWNYCLDGTESRNFNHMTNRVEEKCGCLWLSNYPAVVKKTRMRFVSFQIRHGQAYIFTGRDPLLYRSFVEPLGQNQEDRPGLRSCPCAVDLATRNVAP